jgi:hypothetical protein
MKQSGRLFAIVGVAGITFAGCLGPADSQEEPEPVTEVQSAISTDNPISVRFINVASTCTPMSTSNMNKTIENANDAFAAAGLRFQFYSSESYPLAKDKKGDMVTWNEIRPVWEGLGISCSSCASEPARELASWLFRIVSDYLRPQMVAWLGCGSHRGSASTTSVFLGASGAGSAAHEFGHAFGLPHSFEVATDCNNWDLIYAARGRGKGNSYFSSWTSCNTFWRNNIILGIPFSFFKMDPRDSSEEADVEQNGIPRQTSGGIIKIHHPRCVGCTAEFDAVDDGVEQYQSGDAQISGYARLVNGEGEVNAMTYCSADGCPGASKHFFASTQISTIVEHVNDNPRLISDPTCENGIASSNACCDAACGSCGGSGCSSRPGGTSACCLSGVRKQPSCTQVGPPCIMADPLCLTGIKNGNVCCAPGCGTCGGGGCGSRPGGSAACCVGSIQAADRSCATNMPPCVIP